MERQQKEQQKQRRKKKKDKEDTDEDDNEENSENDEEHRNIPATINNNNEHNNDDNDNNEDSNDNEDEDNDDSPKRSLPNRTHNDLDVPSTKRNEIPSINGIDGEVAKSQATQHLVSPSLNSNRYEFNNYDCNKYDMDLPVAKLDPFNIGAHVQKCVNETLFPICKFFRNNQDVDLFMALVFDEIGMDGFCASDHYKRMTSWVCIRQFIRKRTNDIRQLCVDQWYIVAKSK